MAAKKEEKNQENKPPNEFSRYTGIAVKMAIIVLMGVFVGIKLDRWLNYQFEIFTVLFSIGSCILAMYVIIKEVSR